jgi:hypothetical protein
MSGWISIGCSTADLAGYKTNGCCSSCHSDEEDGYDMCAPRQDYPDFMQPDFCCAVSSALRAQNVDWLQLLLAHCQRNVPLFN